MKAAPSRTRPPERGAASGAASSASARKAGESSLVDYESFHKETETRAQKNRNECQKKRVFACALLAKTITFERQIAARLQDGYATQEEIARTEEKLTAQVDPRLMRSAQQELGPSVRQKLRAGDRQIETLRLSLDLSINELHQLSMDAERMASRVAARQQELRLAELEHRVQLAWQWFLELEQEALAHAAPAEEVERLHRQQDALLEEFQRSRQRMVPAQPPPTPGSAAASAREEEVPGATPLAYRAMYEALEYVPRVAASVAQWAQSVKGQSSPSPAPAASSSPPPLPFEAMRRLLDIEKREQRLETMHKLMVSLLRRMQPLPNMTFVLEDMCVCAQALVRDADSLEEETRGLQRDLEHSGSAAKGQESVLHELRRELAAGQEERQRRQAEVDFLEVRIGRLLELFPAPA